LHDIIANLVFALLFGGIDETDATEYIVASLVTGKIAITAVVEVRYEEEFGVEKHVDDELVTCNVDRATFGDVATSADFEEVTGASLALGLAWLVAFLLVELINKVVDNLDFGEFRNAKLIDATNDIFEDNKGVTAGEVFDGFNIRSAREKFGKTLDVRPETGSAVGLFLVDVEHSIAV